VTGASAGIGRAIARALAARGCHLLLSARRVPRLEALAAEIGAAVRVAVVPADLADPRGPAQLCEAIAGAGHQVDVLVNNAGVGLAGAFAAAPLERDRALLQLNVVSPVELTKRLLPAMLERRRGHVLFVGSVVGYMPVPQLANYAASKAYIRSFAEAVGWETRRSGVGVTLLSPGTTGTDFFETAGYGAIEEGPGVASPQAVAAAAIDGMERGARVVIPGRGNQIVAWAGRVLPGPLVLRIADRIQERRLGRHAR
jgi:short-subunit dehydrogenase